MAAVVAYAIYEGITEPTGWVRCIMPHGAPYRRRVNADPALEYEDRNEAPTIDVVHFELTPASDADNLWRSVCPACKHGWLLAMRQPATFVLQEFDVCTLCGQRVRYVDIDDMRAKDWAREQAP